MILCHSFTLESVEATLYYDCAILARRRAPPTFSSCVGAMSKSAPLAILVHRLDSVLLTADGHSAIRTSTSWMLFPSPVCVMSRNSNSTALVSHLVTQEFMLMYPITHFAPSISTHSFRKQIARCECTRLQFDVTFLFTLSVLFHSAHCNCMANLEISIIV